MSSPSNSSFATAVSDLPNPGADYIPYPRFSYSLPTSGSEDFPPHLGVDEFAIRNPDFWSDRGNEEKYTGWMGFADVSGIPSPSYLLVLTSYSFLVDSYRH